MKRHVAGRFLGGATLAWLCAAPTPGDIGGCGQPAQFLDADAFAEEKQRLDCTRCEECGIETGRCDAACNDPADGSELIVDGCAPLVHDGVVCLRALEHASCDDYRAFQADDTPSTPTECDFCPLEAEP